MRIRSSHHLLNWFQISWGSLNLRNGSVVVYVLVRLRNSPLKRLHPRTFSWFYERKPDMLLRACLLTLGSYNRTMPHCITVWMLIAMRIKSGIRKIRGHLLEVNRPSMYISNINYGMVIDAIRNWMESGNRKRSAMPSFFRNMNLRYTNRHLY